MKFFHGIRKARLFRSRWRTWGGAALVGGLVAALMLGLYVAQPELLTRLDLKIYDLWLPGRAAPEPSPVPVIIDLDEASLAAFGQWPWPRYLMADLLTALTEYEVAAIGLDILMAEADRSSPDRLKTDLRRDRGLDLEFTGLPAELRDYDQLLAETLAGVPAVLAAYARYGNEEAEGPAPPAPPAMVSLIERERPGARPIRAFLPQAGSAILPRPPLLGRAPLGFINAAADSDGVVRKISLVVRLGEEIYPALSLRALMLGLGVERITLVSGPYGLESVQAGGYAVPVSPQGALRLPFIGPRRTYPYFSAAAVLNRQVNPEELRGRVAFVGSSAPGLMDLRATPYDQAYPGVEAHAVALDALLTGNALTVPSWSPAFQALGLIVIGLLSALAFGLARPLVYLPAAGLLSAAALGVTGHLFQQGLFLSPLYFLLAIAAEGAGFLLWRFRQEEKRKLALRNAFANYVSPEIVKRISEERGDLWAGEERELTILFTDLRGFTSISEQLSPRQVVSLLNSYFTPMTALVRENSGTLDKFIGDSLMAFWNAPLDVPDHPALAVTTALAMRDKMTTLSDELKTEFKVDLKMGAGLNTGPAYVGNLGSRDLVNYTLIGDNVNLASRLEGLCPQYGVDLVVSEATRLGCGERWAFQYLDLLKVKGKTRPIRVYRPLDQAAAEARAGELTAWSEAYGLYLAGEFNLAAEALAELEARYPETRLYAVYTHRVAWLRERPPARWDGVWTMKAK